MLRALQDDFLIYSVVLTVQATIKLYKCFLRESTGGTMEGHMMT